MTTRAARRGLHRRVAPVAAALLIASCADAAANEAARPAIQPGDQWKFAVWYTERSTTPNREWIVHSVADNRITGTENGEPLSLTPDLGVLESPRNIEWNPQWLRFPLAVGNRWSFGNDWYVKYKNSKGHGETDAAVVAFEKVTVPAGEFDAFRIEASVKMSGISGIGSVIDAQSRHTYWYAPSARAIVKWHARNPYLGPSTVELVEVRLQP